MIETLSTNHQLLSFIVVSPLLIWGIWIVSQESFDGINAVEEFKLKMPAEFELRLEKLRIVSGNSKSYLAASEFTRSARLRREKILPVYFGAIVIGFCFTFIVIFVRPQLIRPTILLMLFLATLLVFMGRRRASQQKSHQEEFDAELPTQIQLLTVLISSGVSPARAIALLSTRSNSISSQRFSEVVNGIEAGETIVEALDKLAQRHHSLVLRRFITSLILGIERGSSLTPILISQVRDSRLSNKSETLKRAGKAEIALLIPVVFLILPISILFALWPSYQQLGSFL
jgi:Flp pilus assembly protein TadB